MRLATVSAVSLCLLASCGLYREHVELKDLMVDRRVEPDQHPERLHLKGHIISGVLVPKRFESRIENKTLLITLIATLATRGYYNSFDVTFDIPESVDEVRFGTRKELLWSRAFQTSNQSLQPTATRCAFSFFMTKTVPEIFSLAPGSRD